MTEEENHLEKGDKTAVFGFWLYLMTDLIMFAVLFACFAVLREKTFGGPALGELIDLYFVLAQTLLLLTSSLTAGLALVAAKENKLRDVLVALVATFVLGFAFLGMELYEFSHLVSAGHSWEVSASLSSFFALVGLHGIHIFAGLIWLFAIIIYVWKRGLTRLSIRKLVLFGLFWHFLDIVWIFIFTIVYLMGAVI